MELDHLRRLEDLTRRYAKQRPCGAGLGALWGGLVYQFFAGVILGWVLRQAEQPVSHSGSLQTIFLHSEVATPRFLLISAIAAPILIWIGVYYIQGWVDRKYGRVVGEPRECTRFPQWLLPGFVILFASFILAFSLLNHFLLFVGNPSYGLNAWKLGGILAIALLALWWGRAGQDHQARTLMMIASAPSLLVLASGPTNLFMLAFIALAYLALMFVAMIKGALRFGRFLKISQELDSLQPEGE